VSHFTRYNKTVMPDGLRIISESIPTMRSISIGLWVDIGSRDEPKGMEGVSHFIEHMVFKGTASRSAQQIAAYLESVGGILNAFTSREQTCFYAKIIDEHLPRAVEILADLAFNGVIDKDDIEKEKNIVVDEINEVVDTPSDLVHDIFADTIFGKHPLGRPIMGSVESVKGLSREKIMGYIKSGYQPKRMIVAASGNLKHRDLVSLVKKHIPSRPKNNTVAIKREAPKLRTGFNVTFRKTNQTHICIGAPAIRFTNRGRGPLLLLNSIMGGGMSSKLFQKIREDMGMAYTIFSYLDFFMDAGVIGVYLSTDRKKAPRAISTVIKEIERFKENKLPQSEIDSAKEQLKGSLVLGLENTSNRMNRMAKHELLVNKYISVDETITEINKITAKQVRDLANELFDRNKFSLTVLGPVNENKIKNAL
jgi:predicted Zn-dependent peptidase